MPDWLHRLQELYCAGGEAKLEDDEIEWLGKLQSSWKKLFVQPSPTISSSSLPPHSPSTTAGSRTGKAKGSGAANSDGAKRDSNPPVEEQLCSAMLEAVLKVRFTI